MKIAVAAMGGMVAEHFGHCESFLIYDTEEKKAESVLNPGHKPGFLPNFLGDRGVNAIIAGGMGGGAIEIFHDRSIEVVTGARGDALKAAEAYSRGELKTSGSVCHEHAHGAEGHGETC